MRSLLMFAAAGGLLLGGCGGDDGNSDDGSRPDARRPDGATPDAPGEDAPPDAGPACDYTEQHDLTNDDVSSGDGMPEATGLTFGATGLAICGTIENTHFDDDITVDVDSFTITLAADADVLVRITGAAQPIEFVGVEVYTGPTLTTYEGGNTYYGDHGVVALHLPAGVHELQPFAFDLAAPAAPVPYVVTVVADDPATRCPAVTSGGYAEANDGASSIGNDVITIPNGAPPALTTSTADAPEPTALVLGGTATRVTGTAAMSTIVDQYADRDTYLVTTGATTTELSFRVDTTVATADLDFFLFEEGGIEPLFRAISTTRPETTMFAVKPNASYWLLVGAKAASTGLPAPYAATLCPATF